MSTINTRVLISAAAVASCFGFLLPYFGVRNELHPSGGRPQSCARLDVCDSGAVGDGSFDNTTVLNNAFRRASELHLSVWFPPGRYKVTGPLHAGCVIHMTTGAAIVPAGNGYTVLTMFGTPPFSDGYSICINSGAIGAGEERPRLNGIYWDNAAGVTVSSIRVFGFDGFGFRADRMWDSTLESVSVEYCGSADSYAFELRAAAHQTCNETHIVRLQVERSQHRAIYISPNTLNTRISLIHCERTVTDPGSVFAILGGNRGYFGNVRFNASPNVPGKVILDGANTTYDGILTEGDIAIVANCYANSISIRNPDIQGSFGLQLNQIGRVFVENGTIQLASGYLRNAHFRGTILHALRPTDSISLKCEDCWIGNLSELSGKSVGLDGCTAGAL